LSLHAAKHEDRDRKERATTKKPRVKKRTEDRKGNNGGFPFFHLPQNVPTGSEADNPNLNDLPFEFDFKARRQPLAPVQAGHGRQSRLPALFDPR
jgi:hypothetical protein